MWYYFENQPVLILCWHAGCVALGSWHPMWSQNNKKNSCCYPFRWDSFGNQLSFKIRNYLVFHYVRWTELYNNAHICVDGKRALSSTPFQTQPWRLLTGLAACSYSPDPIIFRSFWFGAKLVHKPWPSFLLRPEGDAESVTAEISRLGRTDLRWSPKKTRPESSQVLISDVFTLRGATSRLHVTPQSFGWTRLACTHRLYKSEDSHVVNGTHMHTPV